jgi:N-acetylneuraminate synthase
MDLIIIDLLIFVTAEIGINHNGDLKIAKKLIDVAINAEVDAVKFQKRNIELTYSKDLLDSPRDSPWGKTQRDQKLGLEFSEEDYYKIDKYCKKQKIPWYVSCWDTSSQKQMRKFNTPYNKIASAMLVHEKLLNLVAQERKHTFISTGMSTLKEISNAVKIFQKYNCPFELMHSHSSYPMETTEANLQLIPFLKKKFKCDVGYSGHEKGSYLICDIAVALGATSIERHITLDRTMYGSDQAASLEFNALKRMVRDVKLVQKIMGDGKKRIWDSEIPAKNKLREQLN